MIPCATENENLDLLCTNHGDYLYLSAVNRKDEALTLNIEGYVVISCTEIETGKYAFDCNDYQVCERQDAVVHGHSMTFVTLKKA